MSSEFVLLFAGQGSRATFSSASATTLLNRVAQHDIASLILQRCHESLLQDFSTIDTSERTILTEEDAKSLTTPQDLVKPSATFAQNPVIQAVTFYLHQILEYVFYVQREREGQPHDTISEAAGFCSGILPALVVAVNTPIESPQFLEYAVGTFRLAFWTSIRSASYSKSLAGATWGALPWSLVVAGLTKEALETALTSAQSQLSHRVRVSAVLGDDMFSLSGTGVDLDRLRSLLPTTSTHRPAFIHTCYHGGEDMEEVVQDILRDVKRLEIPFPDWEALKIPVRSTVDGTFLASTQPQSDTLLEAAIRCMLIHPVDWQATASNILDSASQRLDMNAELCSRVLALGPNGGSLFTSAKNTALHQRLQIEHSTSSKSIGSESWHKSDIAIVGMSVDIPGGEDLHAFWDMLQNSTNVSTEIPSSRFNLFDYYDKDASNNSKPRKMAAKHGNFLKNPFHFDNRFFSISPREAKSMDPQQRLILQSALRALDDAGYAPNTTESFQPDKMGVFIGAATGDYVDNTRSDIDVYYSPGTLRAFLSGRISYAFGFKGPSVVIDTACSSSLVAIHQACIALERGDAVSALAGGVNVISSPDMYLGLARAHFLSPTGQCKPFDAAADGYCRAESSVVFVLKRMEDAIAHGDRIHGIIRGTSVNQSGTSKSITHPDAETQALLMRSLLDRTKIPARSISVVEAHGTGTQAGDLCEITSLQAVLGQGSGRQQPLCLGSIKGNIGHAEAASGGVGLAKLLLMMQRKKIPPQASFQHLNPRLSSIADHNIMIPTRVMDWNSTHDSPRRALLNNFGAAGSNAALILEECRTTTWETLGAAVSQATTFESQFFESQTEEEGAAEGSQAGTAATTEASVDTEPDNGDNFDGINWDRLPR
ncbi:Polyketide synthase modules, partial [Pyrenophora tritici-repentis]